MVWIGAAPRPGFRGFKGFGLPLAGWFRGWWWLRRRFYKGGAAGAAGCVEGLWKKVLKMDRPYGPEGS